MTSGEWVLLAITFGLYLVSLGFTLRGRRFLWNDAGALLSALVLVLWAVFLLATYPF